MGGHGGLNILPQKSWHVYRRDNVSQVEKDEAEASKAEQVAKKKHEDEERGHRRKLLLQRAKGGEHEWDKTHDDSGHEAVGHDGSSSKAEGSLLQHINFWSEEEARMHEKHPEVERERLEEKKARGREGEQTTDAAFDKRFKLGYGFESAAQPWYASVATQSKEKQALPSSSDRCRREGEKSKDGTEKGKKKKRRRRSRSSSSSSTSSSGGSSSDSDESRHKNKQRNKSKSKEKPRKKSIEEMREERLEREKVERERERQLLLGKKGAEESRGYNSSFGFADLIKRKR